MDVQVVITGLDDIQRNLGSAGKQVAFAASRALNTTAFAVNGRIKDELQRRVQGGATPYTLRAFRVEKSTKQNLTALVALRTDRPGGEAGGGTPYDQALAHLFTGGVRTIASCAGAAPVVRCFARTRNKTLTHPTQRCFCEWNQGLTLCNRLCRRAKTVAQPAQTLFFHPAKGF